MTEKTQNTKFKIQNETSSSVYDLNERTFQFARDIRELVKQLKLSFINLDDAKQLIRSSGSVAANYIEANESLSKKDFIHRIKICRKEAKESNLWLKLIETNSENLVNMKVRLEKESMELTKIFGAIVNKSTN